MKPGPATDTSNPSRMSSGRAEATASAIGRGAWPALLAAASTPFAWKSPCLGSAVRTPGSKVPGSMPAASAAAFRARSSSPIKSNARCIRPLHHPAGGRRKRRVDGSFWLDIFMEAYWLVRFPRPGAPPLPAINSMTSKRNIPARRFIKPTFNFLIEKKRDGGEFTQEEIRYIIDSTLDGEMPLHQLAALAMAIYFSGMSAQETADLTEEMMLSGEVIDLSHIAKPKIDKYSTGGVGDKTALVLVPLAMASGVVVPMMCGVEHDYVINTLEKLAAIPGFKGHQTNEQFAAQLAKIGGAIVAQNEDLAPADAKLYELRKDTGTIPSLPLITGSVLSKKLAEGAEGLVIDVKWGNGSFIKDLEQAKQLARSMTRVGRSMKRRCVALVTDMNQPLGDSVGTALEVKEAIQLLQGRGPRGREGARAQARHGDRPARRRRRLDAFGQADRPAPPHRRVGAREVQGAREGPGRRHLLHRPSGKIPAGQAHPEAAGAQARLCPHHQRGDDRPGRAPARRGHGRTRTTRSTIRSACPRSRRSAPR